MRPSISHRFFKEIFNNNNNNKKKKLKKISLKSSKSNKNIKKINIKDFKSTQFDFLKFGNSSLNNIFNKTFNKNNNFKGINFNNNINKNLINRRKYSYNKKEENYPAIFHYFND